MSADVELKDVWIKFGDFVAAQEVNITIQGGEFFSFLGPSGCGKTTLLRAVSGFLEPSEGTVSIGGQNMAWIGPNKRPTALIFQNLALFPLMAVWENIAFALEVRGVGKAGRRKKADELLELIALPDQGDKMVHELSGGQKQRVAIARALAAEPEVYAHHGHVVRHGEGFALVVGDVDEGDADPLLDGAELGAHVLAELEVERGERLVEEQHLGLGGQRAGDGDALFLPAGELVDHLVALIG